MTSLIIFSAKYVYLFSCLLVVCVFLILPKQKKKQFLLLGVVYLPITYIVAKIASHLYVDPRPFVVGHFQPLIPHSPDNGFPSDHTLLTSALASLVTVFNRKTGIVAWLLALAVGAARVAAGIHHWIDIIGSMCIAFGTMAAVYYYWYIPFFKTRIGRSLFGRPSRMTVK